MLSLALTTDNKIVLYEIKTGKVIGYITLDPRHGIENVKIGLEFPTTIRIKREEK